MNNSIPVVFVNPFTDHLELMPVEMIGAYFPNGTVLCLEEAAKIAAIRDDEAAQNLLLSATDEILLSMSPEVDNVPSDEGLPLSVRA